MPFVLLILRNLLRQKIRTSLTVIGISIGITAVVALGVITNSALKAAGDVFRAGGADFAVGQAGSSDFTFSTITDQDVRDVEAYDEIEHVTPALLEISKVGSNPFFLQFGIPPGDEFFAVDIVEGRNLEVDDAGVILLGDQAASDLSTAVGEELVVREETGERFTVAGIYDSGLTYFDGGAIFPLADLQEIEDNPNLSYLFVYTKPGTDNEALKAQIEADHARLTALEDSSDVGEVDQGLNILDDINLAVRLLAIFIGGIAAMNTMVMAVFERTREFGILRAVGWRTRRILQMVVGEALLLCMIAAVVGSALAFLLTRLIVLVPTIRAFISPVYTVEVFLWGIAVGVGVALVGAIYPAYRAATFSPAQAIRYE